MEELLKETIQKAGAVLLEHYGHAKVAYAKGDSYNIVTEADLAAEKVILGAIEERFPDHGYVSEESAPVRTDAEYVWYIDPLDGTANFSRGIPLFGVSIGIARGTEMHLGAILLPVMGELYFAQKGKGATLNGERIFCASRPKPWEETLGLLPIERGRGGELTFQSKMADLSGGKAVMLALGSSAVLAGYVASGKRDWGWSRGSGLWDHAAGALILGEAGYGIANVAGREWTIEDGKGLVAAHPELLPELMKIMRDL